MVFSGTVTSDFLKLIPSDLDQKERLIDYSASDFESIRAALIKYAKATFPLDYTNFSESDFGMFLIELMAAVGHIQSMKSDFLANENYLRTARQRSSVRKLLELIGVRLKGPISAAANARIVLDVPGGVTNVSSVVIPIANRTFTITSPEDGGALSYTIYKVNSNGTVDLEAATTDIEFTVSHTSESTITINDAVILEGALVVESGQFLNTDSVKTINLTQSPYVEKSAQVYVEGNVSTEGIYTEEENVYFASGSNDKVFQINSNDEGQAVIVFGDDSIGLSPAVGDTYTVTYRVGGGERGNLAQEVINVPVTATLYSTTVDTANGTLENTSRATGGAEAETIAHARRYAPLTFRRQDRLVTLSDYKGFINSFISSYGSTGKANAIVRRAYSSANIIDLFVLEKASNLQLRKATPEYKRQLLEAIEDKKMLTDEPVVVDGLIRTLDIVVTVTCDRKYKLKEDELKSIIRDKILTYFNVDNTDFGEAFVPQDLVRTLVEVPEVRYATIDNVDKVIKTDFNEIIQLNNLNISIVYI